MRKQFSSRVARRRSVALAAMVATIGAFTIVTAPTGLAGGLISVTIVNNVVGTAPSGATFEVHVSCTNTGPSPAGPFLFDETGLPSGPNSFTKGGDGTCTITEPVANGASVAFQCNVSNGIPNVTCSSTNAVNESGSSSGTAMVTITNTYGSSVVPPASFGTMTVNPNPASRGQVVTVSGNGCTKAAFGQPTAAGGHVKVTVGFAPPLLLGAGAADGTGAWSTQFTVPPGVAGPVVITADCDDPIPYAPATLVVVVDAAPRLTG